MSRRVQQVLDQSFGDMSFWIVADVQSHTYKVDSNHHYFELIEKDPGSSRILAKISARAWGLGSANIRKFEQLTGRKFQSDINALLSVVVQYHASYGLQLTVLDIDANYTLGQFQQQRENTIHRLLTENSTFIQRVGDELVTRNRTLKLKAVIQRIAVISSETAAGYQDFTHTLRENAEGYTFFITEFFTKVQGEHNARAIVERLLDIYYSATPFDAVIIIRGGGSQSDLLLFDNYELSRAVAKFPIPIITGIGHQKNETIVDMVAHTSTKTPTKAAEFVIAHNRAFEDQLKSIKQQIVINSHQAFPQYQQRLNRVRSAVVNKSLDLLQQQRLRIGKTSGTIANVPQAIINAQKKELAHLQISLQRDTSDYLEKKRLLVNHLRKMISVMSPQRTLSRGFALVRQAGRIVTNAQSVEEGTVLTVELFNVEIKTKVTSKKQKDGNKYDL